ncbi:MAG TPA: M42 family metallopeptidase [candidate division Zixibacteria bacterium]|nr:M42 family metallopeptidase [candidate division Zixibacteria bacterium]
MDATIQFLKTLTEADGVPGYEVEIRAVIRDFMEPLGTVTQDKLGSLICNQPGDGPKVMLAGHMDEVGFMITHVTKEGFLKFVQLGGWWDQVLLGHRVVIKSHKGDIVGVIGAKPPHIVDPEERKKVVKKEEMYIDIGATSMEEVEEAGIRSGDPVVPQADFAVMANGKSLLAKAFDDRVGCAVTIDALRHFSTNDHPNDLYGVATVMEEVGLRGARTSAHAIDPDVAIILEVDIAGDVPGIRPEQSKATLGKGPTIILYDRGMIPNLKLRDLFIDTAAELDIPLQRSGYTVGGSTDGAAIHLHGTGVPTVVIGVASRHIHSHGSIIHRDDYENAVKLITAVVSRLDKYTVEGFTE